jgi:hypothetical protein
MLAMMLPVVVRCIAGIIPHGKSTPKAPDVLTPTGWSRGEIHSGYWNLVPQSATDERCAHYVGLPSITTGWSPFSHVPSVAVGGNPFSGLPGVARDEKAPGEALDLQ